MRNGHPVGLEQAGKLSKEERRMGRPSTYQAGTTSTWHGLTYRVAQPCQAKDGRWSTKIYLMDPAGRPVNKGGHMLRTRKGEEKQDLMARLEQEISQIAAEYTDHILAMVRSGNCPGMTLETYAALRRGGIQSYSKWAGKTETYWRHWDERLCPAVGGVELLQCGDPSAVEAKMEQLTHRKRSKRGYTDAERVDWIILSDLLECACRVDGLLPDNPLRAQARKCRERLSTVASRDLARRDLTGDELAALLDKCLSKCGTVTHDAMLVQVLTGLTVPEVCGLNVGDWQQSGTVTWLEITKAYQQRRGGQPAMTKLLDDANNYRKVVCTREVEQVLRRLVASHRGKSRADRGAPLFLDPDGNRLSPQSYKEAVRDVLEEIIRDGARLPFEARGAVLRGANRPTMAHTDLLRNTAAYYYRMVCRCTDAERAALLGYHQTHTYASSYVDWNCELVLVYLRSKIERWHGAILRTDPGSGPLGLGQSGYRLGVTAEPGGRLTVRSAHGVTGMIEERKEL